MKNNNIFPWILILLQFGAAATEAASGNVRMFIYWLAAAVLNCAVTI